MSKIVSIYIVFDLDVWPRNPTNNFKFKNFVFEPTSVIKSSDKEKYVYSGYEVTFECEGLWHIMDNDITRNVMNFGVDNSSLFHIDNCKKNFLVLGEGPTFGINGTFGSSEKKFNINFSKANKCW